MKNKKIAAVLIIVAALVLTALTLVACVTKTQLDKPDGFTLDKDTETLSWNAVDGAVNYSVYFTKGADGVKFSNQIVKEPKVSLSYIREQGEYIVYVQANSDNDDIKDSDIATFDYSRGNNLATPTNIKVNIVTSDDGNYLSVSWDAVANASAYIVTAKSKTGNKELYRDTVTSAGVSLIEFTDSDSSGNEQVKRYTDTPDLYEISVRAISESSDYANSALASIDYTVKGTLTTPNISKLEISGENTKRIRWEGNTEGNGVKVEAWLIGDGESKESVLEKVKAGTYDKDNGGYYSYQPSSKSATSCQISSLNIDKQGEYVLTVTALGDDNGIYDTVGPVSGEKTIFTVRRLADILQADGAVTPQGENAYAELSYINGRNELYDAVKLYVSKSYLDIADTFRIVLSSYNAVSSNALNDISVNVTISNEEGEYKASDTNGGSSLEDKGSYVVITYDLDKLFHGKDDKGNVTHIQSQDASNPAYGRYFKVAVQASNGKTESGQETAYIAGGAATLDNYYLSYCKPESDGNERYFIKTEYGKEGEEISAQIETFAFAKLMYIQALMLSGDDCLGKTFIINENIDARNNPWLSLEGFAGTLTSGKATYTAPDDSKIDENGNYYISNLNIRNAGAIDYENKDEGAKELPSFGKNYGFFASIASSGRISGVNFINVTATDSNYVLEYKETVGDKQEDKSVNLYTDYAGVIAGVNNGSIVNVYVSGSLSGHNTMGGAVGFNRGGASLKAVESAVTVSSVGVKESSVFVGGLCGANNGHISASSALGNVNINSELGYKDDIYIAAGGLIGINEGEIVNSVAENNVGAVSGMINYVGGFVGYNSGTIESSYAGSKYSANIGNINSVAGNVTGGFVGYNGARGTIRSAYSVHRVSGNASDGTGAFAGNNQGAIYYAYAAGRTERNGVELSGSRALFAGNLEGGSVVSGKVQTDISDVSGVNDNTLKQNGMTQAQGYSTLIIDELVYLDAREAKINRNGICEVRAIAAAAGKCSKADYTDYEAFNLEGYELRCEISGGISSFGVAGTTLLKYQIVKGSEVISSSTIVITVI